MILSSCNVMAEIMSAAMISPPHPSLHVRDSACRITCAPKSDGVLHVLVGQTLGCLRDLGAETKPPGVEHNCYEAAWRCQWGAWFFLGLTAGDFPAQGHPSLRWTDVSNLTCPKVRYMSLCTGALLPQDGTSPG